MTVDEPAADLSVVAAVASSVRNRGLAPSTAVFGEIGLSGEIRGVPQSPLRIREAAQMGFTRVIVPTANLDPAESALRDQACELIGVRTVGEALDMLIA
jgi:DNA repair protein RadA/Sms